MYLHLTIVFQSDFVTISAYFSLADIPDELRPHVFIYLSSFFSLPVKRHNGEELTHEEVVNRLDNDTVSYDIGLGTNGRFMETVRVAIRVQTAQYESAVAWLKDLLYGSKFDKER